MAALLEVTLPVFLVIGFGYCAVWLRLFSDGAVDGLMKFGQSFAIPCLLFLAIYRLDIAATFDLALLTSYYSGTTLAFVLGLTGARYIFGRSPAESIAIGFCAMFSNSVLLGLPITEMAYGPGALGPNYVIVAFHAPFCFTIGIISMEITRAAGKGFISAAAGAARSIATNPLMIAIALGFLFNVARLPVPGIASDALNLMAQAGLPAALFALGGILYQYRPEGDLVQMGFILLISLAIHPAVTWTLSNLVFELGQGPSRSAVLTASIGPGVNAFIFANMYGVAKRVVASTVLIGTGVAILSVSAWLAFIG